MKLSIANAILTTAFMFLSSVACSSQQGPYADRGSAGDRGSAADRARLPASTVSDADREFATKAARGGMTEVELGKLAQEKGSAKHTKDYGRMLVDDHSRMNSELKSVASRSNITLPADMGEEHRKTYDRLAKLSGAAFDREFFQEEISIHRKDIDEFQKEASSGSDMPLKDFASRSIPTLQEHLRLAENNGMKK
jgi:putative membrane protein